MATVMPKTANWFTYFPEDYRWSSAVGGLLGSAPYGGSDIGEVDRAARSLRDAVGSQDKTFRVFTAEEGGAQHCRRDYLTHGASVIFDWLAEKL